MSTPAERRSAWTDPGAAVCLVIGALLVTFALSVNFPKAAIAFQSDEATYYTLAYSLARDGDFTFERQDLARVWEEFPTGPEGIFLKRGKHLALHGSSSFPFFRLEKRPDDREDRLYFAKSFIYPLAAAPLVLLFGTNGFLLLHALLLTLDLAAAYAFLRARAPTAAALAYAIVFFFASAAPVYFVWLTPEIFNFSLGLLGLFLGCYKEVAPPPAGVAGGGERSRWSRFLRSPASTYAGAVLIGILAFSKPPYILLAVPLLALALWRRHWRPLVIGGAACALAAAGLFVVNMAISGEANYQGGDRKTFYGGTGFPFQTPQNGFGANAAPSKATDTVLTDVLLSRDALLSVFPRNLVYYVLGRHTGLVPYFFPGVLSLALFLLAGGRRAPFQWVVAATFAAGSVAMLLFVPYTYSGGGGPIGNRYFMGFYPLLLFVTPPLASAAPAVLAQIVGGLFTAQLVLNPFYVSYHPAEHMKAGLYRWLPVELTLLNDLPINVTPSRVRQPLAGTPPVSAFFLDDNAYPLEGEWFWVRGASRTELLLRGPAVPRPDGSFDSKQIDHLTVQVKTGDVENRIIVRSGGGSSDVSLGPGSTATLTVRLPAGLPYKPFPDLPKSYVYWLSIESKTGFTPLFTAGSRDSRYLGAMVRIVPAYE